MTVNRLDILAEKYELSDVRGYLPQKMSETSSIDSSLDSIGRMSSLSSVAIKGKTMPSDRTKAHGVAFSTLAEDQIRRLLDTLPDIEFANLGVALKVFKLDRAYFGGEYHTYSAPSGYHQTYNPTKEGTQITLVPGMYEFMKEKRPSVNLNKDATYHVTEIVKHWKPRSGDWETHDIKDLLKSDDVTPGLRPELRKPWQELLFGIIEEREHAITKEYRDQTGNGVGATDEEYRSQRENVVRAQLVMNSFFQAGYGECLLTEDNLKPVRLVIEKAQEIDDELQKMTAAPNLRQVFVSLKALLDRAETVAATTVPQRAETEFTSGCQLGWGDTERATAILLRASGYNALNLSARNAARKMLHP
jgi:hypothetical protein